MPRFSLGLGGQDRTARVGARNAVSALGQRESFATYVGTWLAGIGIGVVLILTIAGLALFSSAPMQTSAASTSDRTSTDRVGNRPIAERVTLAQEGYRIFQRAGCEGCHNLGGYEDDRPGPKLVFSGNARDSTYVHSIVRWGYLPMPAYPRSALSDQDLYKIIVYLQYAHDNRRNKPEWVNGQTQ